MLVLDYTLFKASYSVCNVKVSSNTLIYSIFSKIFNTDVERVIQNSKHSRNIQILKNPENINNSKIQPYPKLK